MISTLTRPSGRAPPVIDGRGTDHLASSLLRQQPGRPTACAQFGLAYGLLQADFPDRFLLHYFTSSAHSYTRGSLTTPESSFLDRSSPSIAYASVGQTIAPIYLKWALIFEDLRSRTLWLGKALPREWLAATVRRHAAPPRPELGWAGTLTHPAAAASLLCWPRARG
jgi:hypothetical protein